MCAHDFENYLTSDTRTKVCADHCVGWNATFSEPGQRRRKPDGSLVSEQRPRWLVEQRLDDNTKQGGG
ncbi:hypothetical protein MHPYR_470020 [uncultured Mycobacterium sp.]|uniref:Uncharacterized protein n=1 Tax=uncultured Mycobacterium sp. TaxID=171292 RepID=A0A1Y5PG47_9MYCO|nr:hypothetical protein MHPYR_470020 [uncultured Mycobacterium sp.]